MARKSTLIDELETDRVVLLERARREVWAASVHVWNRSQSILDRFDHAGVEWMPLKGAALAWTHY